MSKRCSVACDTQNGVLTCELELPEQASIAEVLVLARQRLGEGVADWQGAQVGVFGRIRPRDYVPADGERIELYRPLPRDPRAARRARAAQARTGRQRTARGRVGSDQ